MRKMVAIYTGNIQLYLQNKLKDVPLFDKKEINHECWFVCRNDPEIKYPGEVVLLDENFIILTDLSITIENLEKNTDTILNRLNMV